MAPHLQCALHLGQRYELANPVRGQPPRGVVEVSFRVARVDIERANIGADFAMQLHALLRIRSQALVVARLVLSL